MRAVFLAVLTALATPASACDIALMLAVDVSGSVDDAEYRIQMHGLAAALMDRSVSAALIDAQAHVGLMQWTGSGRQTVVVHWSEITSSADVTQFARQVSVQPRQWRNFSTAIGEALALALDYFLQVPGCKRHVIDVSGDGRNNEGRPPRDIWDALRAADITVNALAIEESTFELTAYFEDHVITGPGAFTMTATTFEDYLDQIIRKLYRELTDPIAGLDIPD